MGTQVFTASGSDTWDVPNGVSVITIKVWSAGGGGGAGGTVSVGGAGAGGGYAQGNLTVTPGETISVHNGGLGGAGAFGGSLSGGGGGGAGRSSVSRSGTLYLVAGAGGGGSGGDNSSGVAGGDGGEGGGNTGGTGGSSGGASGGGGGTLSDGGAGGTGGENSGTDGNSPAESPNGAGGDGGTGAGTGGGGTSGVTNGGEGGLGDDGTNGFAGGGGGGAGYSGGGGGSASVSGGDAGGGGGGGSNYVEGTLTVTTNTQAPGQSPPNTGDPDYSGSAGVGGNGGGTSSAGSAGNNGRIVIVYELPIIGGIEFVGGSNQYLSTVSNFTPTTNISVSFWLFNRDAAQTGRIVSMADSWEIYLDPDGKMYNDLHWTATSLVSNGSFDSETRYHVVCTRASNNDRQTFIDGVFDNSDSGGTAALPSAVTLYFGVKQTILQPLTGLLEDVRIYDRVLSAAEVATIYSCEGADGIVYGLQHRWEMNENAIGVIVSGAGAVKDSGPNKLNSTSTNSPVYRGTTMKFRRFI